MQTSVSEVLKSLPQDTQRQLRNVWAALAPEEREALQAIVRGIPPERQLLRLLVGMASTHVKTAFGRKHKVAIVGPANVGKSTLYNQFILERGSAAAVSPTPGTTRIAQEAEAGLFTIVDTPGADAIGPLGAVERQRALDAARAADFIIVLFDTLQGVKRTELEVFRELTALQKPYVVALNKSDLARRDLAAVVQAAAANLGLTPEQVIPISAKRGDNISQVLLAVAVSEPELVAALGSAMPAYRWKLTSRSIITAAGLAAVIALTPIPIMDFIPLATTQAIMVVGISRIHGRPITLAMAKEMAATFGLGLAGRTVFQELSKLGGAPGWLLSAAVAAATTVVMGYAAAVWFERRERVKPEAIKQMTEQITAALLDALRSLGRRKPNELTLKARVEQALETLALSPEGATLTGQPAAASAGAADRPPAAG